MPKVIHQLVHTLSYGDAISGEVLALQRCFRSLGFESEIFSINAHPKLKAHARDYREFISTGGENFAGSIILHYSLGSPLNAIYRALGEASRYLIHHNLTPPHWFEGVNPRIVEELKAGLQELPELCALSTGLIADSAYNAGEIEGLGFQAQVLELPIDPKRWEIPSNPGIASILRSEPGLHLLHVGRLAPNKMIEDVIKTFYFLHHHIRNDSRLWLVGIDIDTELYSFALKSLVYELNLSHAVNFVGCLDDSEVKALYENGSVYICMSEHEGFCLPVVEAMRFGMPVVAYASSALPDTLGKSAALVSEKRHAEIAELIERISKDGELRQRMVAAGRERVRQLSFERFEGEVQRLFCSAPSRAQSHPPEMAASQ